MSGANASPTRSASAIARSIKKRRSHHLMSGANASPIGRSHHLMRVRRVSILLFALAIAALPLYGHHGRGATYDMKKRITLKGTVSRVDWRNPHVVIFMDVKDETGKIVTWGFENAGVSQLAQEGYNRNTLKIGQEITAIVNPAANGA